MRATRRRLEPGARRQEIIDSAERLLKRDGPGTRVEDVVSAAGAAKGTFYLYFPSWDDLLEAIRARLLAAFDAGHPLPTRIDATTDWPRLLDRFAVAFVDGVVAMGGMHAVLFHSDFAERRPIPAGDNPANKLSALIRAGQEAGAFARLDLASSGRLLFAVIHETADAVAGGADRKRALAAMRWILRRSLARGAE